MPLHLEYYIFPLTVIFLSFRIRFHPNPSNFRCLPVYEDAVILYSNARLSLQRIFHPAKNKMLGHYWILVVYGRTKGRMRFSLCTVNVGLVQSQSAPVPPSGPVEQPWRISAYDQYAGRPYTHQATGSLLCSMPWNKQIGHTERDAADQKQVLGLKPTRPIHMNDCQC